MNTGLYKDKQVTLNEPFETPTESKKYAVYAKNSAGDVVLVRFDGEPVKVIRRRTAQLCIIKNRSMPLYRVHLIVAL